MRDAADPVKPEDLWRQLAAAPHRYDFFHALRLIDALHPDKPRLGTARRPVDEPVRLGQAADLSFAASAISKVDPADRSGRPRVEVRFFGLFGPNGPLPLHMTAHARERLLNNRDATFTRFADWFHTGCCCCSTAPGRRRSPRSAWTAPARTASPTTSAR